MSLSLIPKRVTRFRFKCIKTHSHRGDHFLVYCSQPRQDCVRGALCSLLCTSHSSLHLHQVGVKCPHSALLVLIHTHLTLTLRSTKVAKRQKNHPQHPAVPGLARLLGTDVPLLWVASLSPPTPSSVSEVRELHPAHPAGCCCGISAFYTAFFQARGKKRQIFTCAFIPLLPSAIFVNYK